MGCCYSRIEREEIVSRCKARKRYMKQLVRARQALSASHAMYLRSLRSTGASLLHFSVNEATLHHPQVLHGVQAPRPHHAPLAFRPPQGPPPISPGSQSGWTSTTASSALPPPPPPPPPPVSSTWDFWDPFVPPPPSSSEEEEWEEETATATASDAAPTVSAAEARTAPVSETSGFSKETAVTSTATGSELAMVVSRHGKDLGVIVKEVDEYFLRAADAGGKLSCLLEVSSGVSSFGTQGKGGKLYDLGCNLAPSSLWSWRSSRANLNYYGNMRPQMIGGNGVVANGVGSHSSTVERLYAWEKKLYQEVKNAETIKVGHEKKLAQVRKLEMKRADYVKTEKAKKEVEKLESLLMVSTQAIETTSAEIIKLRETELYPQLVELVKGFMCMWRSMYESHQVQTHIAQQLKYLNTVPSTEPTSEIHKQATLQLELEIQQWHQSFCNLVKAQRDYAQSLTGWLRLSLFQFGKNPLVRSSHESKIYTFCEEWHLAIDRIPDKVASEGIKSLLTAVQGIVAQQAEEHKQKKKAEAVFKAFENKAAELRILENKYGPFSMPETGSRNPVADKKAKVEILKTKAEEEKNKHGKAVCVTRALTLNNLQMGFPHVFQAMVGFSSVCMQAFESVYNQAKSIGQEIDVKRLMP